MAGPAPLLGAALYPPVPSTTGWRGGRADQLRSPPHICCVQMWMLAGIYTPSPGSRCASCLGIYESDDINAIMSEMEKAFNYSQKVGLRCGANDCPSLVVSWGGRIKDHKPGSLKQERSVLSVSDARSLNSRCQRGRAPSEGSGENPSLALSSFWC